MKLTKLKSYYILLYICIRYKLNKIIVSYHFYEDISVSLVLKVYNNIIFFFREEIEKLKGENEDWKREKENWKRVNENWKKENENLKRERENWKRENENLKREKEHLKKLNENLKQENGEMKNRIEENFNKVSNFEIYFSFEMFLVKGFPKSLIHLLFSIF